MAYKTALNSDLTIKHPAMRYHGGKWRLAKWVISHMPEHRKYVEPFGGAAGVLLQKEPAYCEVYNDLDSEVVNFFRVLRDPVLSQRLIDACVLTPYARAEFELAYEPANDPVELARRLVVRASMGFGSAGATHHQELIEVLHSLKGMVMVCGYESELYEQAFKGWTKVSTTARISAFRGTKTKTECMWLNPSTTNASNLSLLLQGVAA